MPGCRPGRRRVKEPLNKRSLRAPPLLPGASFGMNQCSGSVEGNALKAPSPSSPTSRCENPEAYRHNLASAIDVSHLPVEQEPLFLEVIVGDSSDFETELFVRGVTATATTSSKSTGRWSRTPSPPSCSTSVLRGAVPDVTKRPGSMSDDGTRCADLFTPPSAGSAWAASDDSRAAVGALGPGPPSLVDRKR